MKNHPNGLTPDEIILEDEANPKIIKKRLKHAFNFCAGLFINQSEDNVHNNSVIGIYGRVKGFSSHNLDVMPKIKTPRFRLLPVLMIDAKTPLTVVNEDGEEKIEVAREKFKKFFNYLPLRNKAIVTSLLSSEMNIGDTLNIKIEMIKNQDEFERIFFNKFRSKTDEILFTFWSKEATSLVRQYVNIERMCVEDNEFLFVAKKTKRPLRPKDFARRLRRVVHKKIIPLKKGIQSPAP